MGGSESKSSIEQEANTNITTRTDINILNSTTNTAIVNSTIENVKKCSSSLLQTQNIRIIGLTSGGDINIDSTQVQAGMLNFACAQEDIIHNEIKTEMINEIMNSLSSNVDNGVLSDLGAIADSKSTDEWGSFPWGGADSESDVSQTINTEINTSMNKDLRNVVKLAVETNFTNKNFNECINKVVLQQEFLAQNLTSGGNITLTVNQDQAAKVYAQCIQDSKISNFVTQNIVDFLGIEVREDVSSDVTSILDAESYSEGLSQGPLGAVGGLVGGVLDTLLAPLNALFGNFASIWSVLGGVVGLASSVCCCCIIIMIILSLVGWFWDDISA